MIKAKKIENKKIWENFALNCPDANFLQSWNWGQIQKALGKKIFRIGYFKKNKIEGISLLILQTAKRGRYLECPAGPLIDWRKPLYFEEFIRQAKEIGAREDCSFIRIRPQLIELLANRILLKKYGFTLAPMHLHAENTLQLNLEKSEEQLLRGMRKNTRYLIKKARQFEVKIEQSKDIRDIGILHKLQVETVQRKHFVPFSKNFFETEFSIFLKDNQIRLFKAIYQKKVLAAALIVFYNKEAVYHYSGSSSRYRKIPASYLLQWEAILEAKKLGCKKYNFWGIAPAGSQKHRFSGVTLFKKGFGGEEVNYLHTHDFPLKTNYWLVYIFEKARKFFRRL